MNNSRDLTVSQATHLELVEATEFYSKTLKPQFSANTFIMAVRNYLIFSPSSSAFTTH